MISLDTIKAVTEVFDRQTILLQKVLMVELPKEKREFMPESKRVRIEDLSGTMIVERKNYPHYISMDKLEAYVFFNINCSKKSKYLLRFGRTLEIKGWINDKYIYCANTDNQKDVKLMWLNQGDNFCVLKLRSINEESKTIDFTLRVDMYEELIVSNEWELFADYFDENVLRQITLLKKCISGRGEVEIVLIPLDYVNLKRNMKFELEIKDDQTRVFALEIGFYEKILFPYQNLSIQNTFLNIEVRYKVGIELYSKKDILLLDDDIEELVKCRREWLYRICENEEEYNLQSAGYTKQDKYCLDLKGDSDYNKYLYNEMKEMKKYQKKTNSYIEYIKRVGGLFALSYKFRLDNSIYTYTIFIPRNYKEDFKYPLVIVFPYYDERPDLLNTMFREKYENAEIEDAIYVQVNTLGQTMSSYVGDIAVINCIEDVKKKFSVNEDRIYGMGYSLGSYSVFTMAQNHPDLFAAIFVCSGEYIKETVENIQCLPLIYISSSLDQKFARDKYIELICRNEFTKMVSYDVKYDYHRSLCLYFQHVSRVVLEKLFSNIRRTPDKLILKVQRLKYNKAFGIEILDMINYKQLGCTGVQIRNGYVDINVSNIKKLWLKLTEKREITVLRVNGKKIKEFSACCKDNVIELSKTGWICREYDEVSDNIEVLKHINLGVLYVFMDTMGIIYSQKETVVTTLVKRLQSPVLFMQNDPQIFINYPSTLSESLKTILNENKNLIVVECGENTRLLDELRQYYELGFDKKGCCINGEYFELDYSIIYLRPHPMHQGKYILIIYANNMNQFQKNIYLRRIFMPSYTYGIHPLNESGIICTNGNYYFIS